MELRKTVSDRDTLARVALAVVLAAIAISSFRKRKRLVGALAGAGAVAIGYSVASGSGDMAAEIGLEPTSEEGELRCSVCGEPIRPGQRRKPDANNETAHEACLEASA